MKVIIGTSPSSSIKIAIWKDERLEYLNIPKGLIELLQINDFTIEKILEYGPSKIAETLVIDNYVAQIIFNETNNNKYEYYFSNSNFQYNEYFISNC